MNRDALLQTIYNWYGPITGSGHDIAALADTILALPWPSPEVLAKVREYYKGAFERQGLSEWHDGRFIGADYIVGVLGLLDAVTSNPRSGGADDMSEYERLMAQAKTMFDEREHHIKMVTDCWAIAHKFEQIFNTKAKRERLGLTFEQGNEIWKLLYGIGQPQEVQEK